MSFALPVFVDAFCFETNSLILGTYPDHDHFSAHVSLTNLFFLLYCGPMAMSSIISTFISNSIGERNIY